MFPMANPRRKFTKEEKLGILQKAGEMGITAVLHEYHLSYSVFSRWKNQLLNTDNAADSAAGNRAKYELKALQEENKRLKMIIADQALELERKEGELRKYNTYGKR